MAPVVDLEPEIRIVGALFGAALSRRRGHSDDVVGSRPYLPGDDIRRIDWRSSARLSALHGEDRFLVFESYAEEAPIVLCLIDRSPSMALYPEMLPWLHKPVAAREIVRVLTEAAAYYRAPVGMLGSATDFPLFERPRRMNSALSEEWEVEAAEGTAVASGDEQLSDLYRYAHFLPPGSFVFWLSDFAKPPSARSLDLALDCEWNLVPVVIRDPRFEQSFPDEGAVLALSQGKRFWFGRARKQLIAEQRLRNEQSQEELLELFEQSGFPALVVSGESREAIVESFAEWADRKGLL